MGFGKEIKRLRLEANKISVDKIAGKVGVNADRWRKWEQKDGSPRQEDTIKIEDFFGMTIDELMKQKSIKKFLSVPNVGGEKMAIGLDRESMAKEILHLKALTKALLHGLAKLKSKVTGRSVQECLDEVIDDTTLIMNDPGKM